MSEDYERLLDAARATGAEAQFMALAENAGLVWRCQNPECGMLVRQAEDACPGCGHSRTGRWLDHESDDSLASFVATVINQVVRAPSPFYVQRFTVAISGQQVAVYRWNADEQTYLEENDREENDRESDSPAEVKE